MEFVPYFVRPAFPIRELLASRESFPSPRVYWGPESCERLLPTPGEAAGAVMAVRNVGVSLTLVTPALLSERGLKALESVLRAALRAGVDEIVVNDWGAWRIARELGAERIVLGRLFHRMKRDPRLDPSSLDASMAAELRGTQYANPVFCDFLKRNGIVRIELDATPQGIDLTFAPDFHRSICYGLMPVALAPICIPGATHRSGRDRFDPEASCRRECEDYSLFIESVGIAMIGRAAYMVGRLPPGVDPAQFDRVVQVFA